MTKKLGHYDIVAELGRGGMGVVYKAHEQSLNRYVAIKVLGEQVAGDPNLVARFLREARSAAALNHPNITQIYFIGEDQGQHYFVMEYVSGKSLSELIRSEKMLAPKRAAELLLQTASGLAVAHDRGIIHRDIKPANIMITPEGLVKIADFGIAHVQEDMQEKLTATGQFLGTPGYLSPEVCLGQPMDHRSDIFSLGIVYYEMLTGCIPFNADSPLAMMREVVEAAVPDVRALNDAVDLDTHMILSKMIEKKKERRYQDCRALVADLQRYLGQKPNMAEAGVLAASAPETTGYDQPTAAITQPADPFELAPTEFVTPPRAQTADQPPPPPQIPEVAPPIPRVEPAATRRQDSSTKSSRSKVLPLLAVGALFLIMVAAGLPLYKVLTKDKTQDQGEPIISDTSGELPVERFANETTEHEDPATSTQPPFSTEASGHVAALEDEAEPQEPTRVVGSSAQLTSEPGGSGETTHAVEHQPETSSYEAPAERLADTSSNSRSTPVEDGSPTRMIGRPAASGSKTPTHVAAVKAPVRLPDRPKVAVIIAGEPKLGRPLRKYLEEQLSANNLPIIDIDMISGYGPAQKEENIDLMSASDAARGAGADAVVVVELAWLGDRELNYGGGRSTTASKVMATYKCFFPEGRRKLGTDFSDELEYTSLNSSRKAEASVLKAIDMVMANLKAG